MNYKELDFKELRTYDEDIDHLVKRLISDSYEADSEDKAETLREAAKKISTLFQSLGSFEAAHYNNQIGGM